MTSDGETPTPGRRRSLSGVTWGWCLFAVALCGASIVAALSLRGPLTGEEAAIRLAAESLVRDGDLVFDLQDETRMRMRGWSENVHPPMIIDGSGIVRFEGPFFYPLLLSPLSAAFGRFGALVLNALLLLATALIAASSLDARCGRDSIWTIIGCVFGSILCLYLAVGLPVLLLVSATAAALSLLAKRAATSSAGLPEMYEDVRELRRPSGRFVAAGALLGVVAAHDPVYLLLLATPLALTHRRQWLRATLLVVIGAAAVLAASWLVGGLWLERGLLPADAQRVEVSVGQSMTGVERSRMADTEFGLDLSGGSAALLAWNAVYALIGRNVGLLPYFAPLILLLALWRPTTGRGLLLLLAGVGLAASLVAYPFDFAGLPAALGNRIFVPFFVLLWWLPARSFGRRGALGALALGCAFLWPLWMPGEGVLARVESGEFPSGPLFEVTPGETTQRDLPVRGEVVTRDLLVRPRAGLQPAGRRGHFVLPKDHTGELMIASPQSVRRLSFVFDAAAASALVVKGGTVESMTMNPDGGVGFDVVLDEGIIRHPVWWSREIHTFNRLRLSMPDARGATVFSIGSGS